MTRETVAFDTDTILLQINEKGRWSGCGWDEAVHVVELFQTWKVQVNGHFSESRLVVFHFQHGAISGKCDFGGTGLGFQCPLHGGDSIGNIPQTQCVII